MNAVQEDKLVKLFNSPQMLKVIKKVFDRSFSVKVCDDAGLKTVRIQFVHEDNGQSSLMTASDVAAMTHTDSRTVRRWCENRSQTQSEFPIPFFRLQGLLRFERTKIQDWIKQNSNTH